MYLHISNFSFFLKTFVQIVKQLCYHCILYIIKQYFCIKFCYCESIKQLTMLIWNVSGIRGSKLSKLLMEWDLVLFLVLANALRQNSLSDCFQSSLASSAVTICAAMQSSMNRNRSDFCCIKFASIFKIVFFSFSNIRLFVVSLKDSDENNSKVYVCLDCILTGLVVRESQLRAPAYIFDCCLILCPSMMYHTALDL